MKKFLSCFGLAACIFSFNPLKGQSDNPCGAPALAVGSTCSPSGGNLSGTTTTGVPAPGCASFSGPDVWYTVTVPASGSLTVDLQTSGAGPYDMGMAWYTGTCGSLSLYECDDDDGTSGNMPMIQATGLTPGATIWVRLWAYGGGATGPFTICATTAATPGPCTGGANNNCSTADPFCTGTAYNYCNTTGVPSMGQYNCLYTTPNPMWMYLNIQSGGNIDILIEQFTTAGAPIDVDFALYGPFTSVANACAGISPSTTIPASYPSGTLVDCSYSGAATETANIPGAVAGQWYMLLITNYAGSAGYIEFSQTGGAGTTNCSIVAPCSLTATPTNPLCNGGNGSIAVNVTGGTPPYTVNVVNSGGTTVATQSGSGTTYNFAGLPAGTYTINLTAAGPCTNSTTATITQPAALNLTSSHTNLTCATPCTGTLGATATGGTGTIAYSWSGGLGAGANKTGVCAGTYTVTATDANGCTATSTQTVTAPSAINLTASATPATCFGTPTGTLTSNATGGTGAITYSWSGGLGTGANKTGVPAGTYTVTATDANGCTATQTVTVNNGPNITPSFTYTGNGCLTGNSFNFTNTSTVTGGVGATTYSWNFGGGATPATSTATSPTGVTYSTTGTHTVTLTVTNNGCTQTVSQVVTTYPMPTVSIVATNLNCNGVCNGTLTATGSGGTPVYAYNWGAPLGTGPTKTGVCAGTYTVTLTDASGCTATATATITQPPVLTVNATGTNVLCNGVCNGTVNATAAGGTAPYTYNWGALGTGASKTGLCAGTYTVTVTDANGCTATASYTVTQPPVLNLTSGHTNLTCATPCNGTLTSNATGGTGAITYSWSGGLGAGANKTGVCAGTYTVTATDANGCTATSTQTITAPAPIVVNVTGTNLTCNGVCTGTLNASATGGTGAYTFSWSGGLGTGANKTGVCAGTYTVTVTDANGCTGTANFTITQPPVLGVTIAPVALTCNAVCNGQATANVTGGTTPYTYAWNNATLSTTATTAANLCASPYTVNITDANGCTATASVTVTQPTAINLTTSSTNTNCGGSTGTATVNATGGAGGYTYSWSPGGQTTATATGLAAGSYTVTVTDANGCTATAIRVVNNNAAPTVTEIMGSHVNVLCNGGNNGAAAVSTTGGTGPYTYSWVPSGGTGSSISGRPAGTYTVTVTDANGCTATANITITQPPALVTAASVTSNVSCNGGNNGGGTVTATGGTAPYTYSWAPSGGTASSISGRPAGTYTVTVTDANGCISTASITITQPPALTASATGTNVTCNGSANGSANLTVAGGVAPYTFAWTGPSAYTSVVEDPTGLAAGTYNVTVTDANGCTTTASVTITQPPLLSAGTTPVHAHCGQSDGSATTTVTGGTGAYTYSWTPGGGTGSSITGRPAGTYTVTVTDANGCTASSTVTINDIPGPAATASVVSNATGAGLCNGSATVTVTGGTAPYTYAWTGGATTITATNLCAGSNCVTVTDAAGCQSVSCVTITQPGPLTVTLTPSNPICNGACNGSVASLASGGVAPYTYAWSSGQTSANINLVCAGTYTLTVTDANGNTVNASATLTNPPAIVINLPLITPPGCFGSCDGVLNTTATGGTGALTYSITGLTGGPLFNGVCAGVYTLNVTDANGCIATQSITVTQPPALTVAMSSVNASCTAANGSATATPGGGVGPYSFLWSNGATTATAAGLASGSYSVTVTDSKGCTITANVTVGNNSGGTATASVLGNVSCFGGSNGSATVNMTGGTAPFTYSWNSTPVQTTQNATGLPAGTYTVTVTDANGCTATSNITITQPPVLTVSATNTPVLCFGGTTGSVNATGTGGAGTLNYNWSGGLGAGASHTAAAGTYTVTVTDGNGCTATASTTVTQPTLLTSAVTMFPTKCDGSCDGSVNVTPAGGTTPYTYLWDDPLAQTSGLASSLCAGPVQVVVTDANGCTSTSNATVTSPPALAGNTAVTDAHCGQPDGSICATITGGTTPYTYAWNSGQTTNCVTSVVAGAYVLNVTDFNNCTFTIAATIMDLGSPNATILTSTNVSCNGNNDGSATVNVAGGTIPYTIQWDAAAGSQTTPTASNLVAGTYGVSIIDAAGCATSTTVTITQPNILFYNVNEYDPICNGDCNGSLGANVIGGTTPYTYQWLNSAGTTIGSTDSIAGLCDGTYTMNITDANGCTTNGTFTLTEPVPVTANVTTTNVSCFSGCNGTATANPLTGVAPFSYSWTTGQTAQTATGLCAGPTTVTVTDDDGCTASYPVNITEPTQLVASISLSQMVSCNGLCDGFADITIVGGTPAYGISWSNGPTTSLNNNLCIGAYTATVTDANGCTDTANITINQPNGLDIDITKVDLLCYNQCTGSATASITGGTLPYTMLWNDATLSTTTNITGACAGLYTITVTDGNGCFLSESVNITQPLPMGMNMNPQDAFCGQDNGFICSSTFGGVPPFTYLWNDPAAQSTPCALNLFSGCYTLTVTDANGCVMDSLVCINDIAGPTINVTAFDDVSCFGASDGEISVAGAGGTGVLTYSWMDGAGASIPSLNNLTSAATLAGDTYAITVEDSAGCQSSVTQFIDEPALFVAAISASTNVSCNTVCDGTASVITAGGNGGNTYAWTAGAALTSANNTGLCAGSHTVTITDMNGCTATATVTITQPAPLVSTVGSFTNVDCFGNCNGTVNLNTSGGTIPYTYLWTGGAAPSANINGLCAGSYTAAVSDDNGCSVNVTQVITEPVALSVTTDPVNASCGLCNGTTNSTALGGTAPYSYLWTAGATPGNEDNSGLCPGLVSLTVTDDHGCTVSEDVTILDQPGPVIVAMDFTPPNCNGDANGEAVVNFTGGTGTVAILWSDAGAQTTSTAVGLPAGNYCVTLTDDNNCTTTQCGNVTEPNVLTGVADLDQTICYGDSAEVFASGAGGTPPYSAVWTTPGMTGIGPIIVNPTTTTTYCVAVTDSKGCVSPQDCATITVNPQLSLTVSPDVVICAGDNTILTATASGGNGGPYNFTWETGTGAPVAATTAGASSSATVSPATTTTYHITVDDACTNPVPSDSVVVTVNPLPLLFVNVSDPDGCIPYNAQFIINSDIGHNFLYDFNCDGVTDEASISTNVFNTYENAGTYDVCVTAISAAGCSTTVSQPGFVTAYPLPLADFVLDPSSTSILDPIVSFTETATGEVSYHWDFGDGDTISGANGDMVPSGTHGGHTSGALIQPTHMYSDSGHYNVVLTVTNEFGCTDDATYPVVIVPDYQLFVPNAFTPDGDGLNDVLYVRGIGIDIENFEFYVFNRWGEIIFESHSPNKGWDGMRKGQPCKEDVYVWKVKTKDYNSIEHEYTGHVTLLR